MQPDNASAGMGTRRAIGAVLFLQAGMLGMDVFSAVNSSPWTVENFGADERKAASVREYVHHGVVITLVFAGASSAVAGSVWPIVGAAGMLAYMYWLYMRALKRGSEAGSDRWHKDTAPSSNGGGRRTAGQFG